MKLVWMKYVKYLNVKNITKEMERERERERYEKLVVLKDKHANLFLDKIILSSPDQVFQRKLTYSEGLRPGWSWEYIRHGPCLIAYRDYSGKYYPKKPT